MDPNEQQRKKQRMRSVAIAWALGAIALLFFIVLMRVLFRNRWMAVGGAWLIMTVINAIGGGGDRVSDWFFASVLIATVLTVLLRSGLLATILSFLFADLFLHLPMTLDFSAWYAPWAVGVFALASILPLCGFYTSMAGRPLFQDVLQEA